jgi:hypothetical protein
MNWYSKQQLVDHIYKMFRISNISMVKTASLGQSLSTQLDWKGQVEDDLEFGNFQRYVCDSQTVKIFMTKTSEKYAVSLITNHTYLGTAGWSIFWSFNLDEKKNAIDTFKEVSKIARKTTAQFIMEETPTVLLHSTLRQKFKHLERGDVIRTNNPIINYSYDINYEPDWRKSIYGLRYPTYKEVSFDKHLNSSIYSDKEHAPSGKFAL